MFIHSEHYMEHAHCVMYDRPLILFDQMGNIMVGLSYVLIPILMLRLILGMWEGLTNSSKALIVHGAAFVLLCGLTHFLTAWNWHNTWYVTQALLQLLTGVVSLAFAIRLFLFIRGRKWEPPT